MKEIIQKLLVSTDEQITNFTIEDTNKWLETYQVLLKLKNNSWMLFKSVDTDKSDARTLQLMNNHADGSVIKQMKKFQESVSQFSKNSFFSSPPIEVEDNTEVLENMQKMACFYLEFSANETELKNKESLVQKRNEEIILEQPSNCRI